MARFRLEINQTEVNKVGRRSVLREATETTRMVLNRAIALTPVKTGNLRAQNKQRVRVRGLVAVGEVFNTASYAPAVHDGFPAQVIRPRKRKVLRFEVGGEVVFARQVKLPARKGRPWLYRAATDVAVPRGYKLTKF